MYWSGYPEPESELVVSNYSIFYQIVVADPP